MDTWTALGSGLLAGLALAVPLGAIGVLLVQEGAAVGLRAAWPCAAAVAGVDVAHCAVAVLAGAAAGPVVMALDPWPAVLGGCALLAVAVRGWLRSRHAPTTPAAAPAPDPAGRLPEPHRRADGRRRRRAALFLGLTATNPATLVFFLALTTGHPQLAGAPATGVLFVTGAGAASFAWQLVLVSAGALLLGSAEPRARRVAAAASHLLVAGLGVSLLVGAAG